MNDSATTSPAPPVAKTRRFQIVNPDCPLGLRIMAIVNFVIGALGAGAVIAIAVAQDGRYNMLPPREVQAIDWRHYLMVLMRLASAMTIIFSGVGYLRLRRLQGWVLGNLYACIALANTLLYALLLKEFGTSSLLWLPYPVLTLFFLNTTYLKAFSTSLGEP